MSDGVYSSLMLVGLGEREISDGISDSSDRLVFNLVGWFVIANGGVFWVKMINAQRGIGH